MDYIYRRFRINGQNPSSDDAPCLSFKCEGIRLPKSSALQLHRNILIAFCFISAFAIAESTPPECIKQKPAEPFSGKIPKNFILIPPCKDATAASEYDSTYIFFGDATVSGNIRYEDNEVLGYYPTFSADQQSTALLPTNVTSFRLNHADSPRAEMLFNLPKLTSKATCWEARAKIRIKYIDVEVDSGTDGAGQFLIDYAVVSVGKYQSCKL
jgi:hypothetical protein